MHTRRDAFVVSIAENINGSLLDQCVAFDQYRRVMQHHRNNPSSYRPTFSQSDFSAAKRPQEISSDKT